MNSSTGSIIAITLALLTPITFAKPNKAEQKEKKEERQEIKKVVEEKDGADVPPELRTKRADTRLEKLRLLMVQGIKDKQLTKGEVASAQIKFNRIEREEESYKQNNKVTPRERKDLNRDLNDLHEYLWEKTHNGSKATEPLVK